MVIPAIREISRLCENEYYCTIGYWGKSDGYQNLMLNFFSLCKSFNIFALC